MDNAASLFTPYMLALQLLFLIFNKVFSLDLVGWLLWFPMIFLLGSLVLTLVIVVFVLLVFPDKFKSFFSK